ncbi:ASST-domain-containing protein, partial [Elsinoe ampelina]
MTGPVANLIVGPANDVSPSKYVLWAASGPEYGFMPPAIIDAATLNMVWSGPIHERSTMGPTVQSCNGTDYITWWSGINAQNHKRGRWYLYDRQYELAFNLTAHGNLAWADVHELYLTPQCTAVISAYQPVQADLSYFNITNGWLVDSFFQEIDMATGELLFEWQASKFVDIKEASNWSPSQTDSGYNETRGWDYFHLNSIEKDVEGNYLLSARHTNAVYYVSGFNGEVLWTLGGIANSFEDLSHGKATSFKYQHMARWVDARRTKISIFDDRNSENGLAADPLSRGLIVELDFSKKTVRLDRMYLAANGQKSIREGSMQVLGDSPDEGNVLLGFGSDPSWTEYSQNGTVLWDVAFGPMSINRYSPDNYRALKVNFTGRP